MGTVLRTRVLAATACAALLLCGLHLTAQQIDAPDQKAGSTLKPVKLDVTFSGPFTHENLTLFMLHGEDKMKGKNFLTLPEAMAQKKVVIYETKQVNDLQVENVSPTEEVLLLAGDIISGGQQDRVITLDQILPPKSGKQPLLVHCVEQTAARWMSAYTKENKTFYASDGVLNSKALKLANSVTMSQHIVWKNVEVTQRQLSTKLKAVVNDAKSESSLNLTLQTKEVKQAADKYITKLQDVAKGKNDVVGYAFAINGKIYGVDVYGSNALFLKVWPRLLQANATEAVMEQDPKNSYKAADLAKVKTFLADAAQGKVTAKDVGKGIQRIQNDAKGNTQIQTFDPKAKMLIRDVYFAH